MKIAKALAVISVAAAQERSEIIFRQIMLFLVFKELAKWLIQNFLLWFLVLLHFAKSSYCIFFSSNRMRIPISLIPGSIIPDSTIPGSITPVSAVWTTLALKLTLKVTILAMASVERLTQFQY